MFIHVLRAKLSCPISLASLIVSGKVPSLNHWAHASKTACDPASRSSRDWYSRLIHSLIKGSKFFAYDQCILKTLNILAFQIAPTFIDWKQMPLFRGFTVLASSFEPDLVWAMTSFGVIITIRHCVNEWVDLSKVVRWLTDDKLLPLRLKKKQEGCVMVVHERHTCQNEVTTSKTKEFLISSCFFRSQW